MLLLHNRGADPRRHGRNAVPLIEAAARKSQPQVHSNNPQSGRKTLSQSANRHNDVPDRARCRHQCHRCRRPHPAPTRHKQTTRDEREASSFLHSRNHDHQPRRTYALTGSEVVWHKEAFLRRRTSALQHHPQNVQVRTDDPLKAHSNSNSAFSADRQRTSLIFPTNTVGVKHHGFERTARGDQSDRGICRTQN